MNVVNSYFVANCSSKGLAKLGNIAAETLFLVVFPRVAKLAGSNKQNVLLLQ